MDFRRGFELWRGLGFTGSGEHVSFAALTAIHYTHRIAAYLVAMVLTMVALRMHRQPALHPHRNWLVGLVLWQFASGVTNVVMDWPLAAAVAHTGGAAALVMVLAWTLCQVRAAPIDRPATRLHAARAPA